MKISGLGLIFIFIVLSSLIYAQDVSINSSSIDSNGRIQIQIESSTDYYYILHCKPTLQKDLEWIVSITLGEIGTTTLTEQLRSFSVEHYRVTQHLKNTPVDSDKDGINDIEELDDLGRMGSLNPAPTINSNDGTVCVPDKETFEKLSYKGEDIKIDVHLIDLEFVKFYIIDSHTDNPKVYFMNTQRHRAHASFARAVGLPHRNIPNSGSTTGQMRGEIIYHPTVLAPSGKLGVYRFEFEPNDSYTFEKVQMANELLAANMQLLKNNLMYYPMPNAALPKYKQEKNLYDNSRVAILLEEDIYADVNFLALNHAEGYGLLRLMALDERPNSRDIVIYEALPNEMPRVGGIITTVPQTPLSHVNLRAIQDKVPNAYIKDALEIMTISDLIGKYVYYKVDANGYQIREATLHEVEVHYENLRPTETQFPVRDLTTTQITPLDNIDFEQWKSFGVKAANMATMRKFGFPEGPIPNGFAVPFYFYDEFMKYNNFYSEVENMLANSNFQNDYNVQDLLLSDFRKTIKDGEIPNWMLDDLSAMQNSFPEGTSIRCRSSTNNEDLPGFSGAGLYDSKTQHPDEGHISKSIKQVFASLWNFRAFDERQFYRIDHFSTAMGVLCHPNFSDELANGVGVSTDPIYFTENTYYLNTQMGEDLVTNPESLSIPEEILLNTTIEDGAGYTIIRPSNLVANGEQLLSETHLNELREYLRIIHNEFKKLYNAELQDNFAMEIEYKITSENILAIKQARPWVVDYDEDLSTSSAKNQLAQFTLKQNYPNPFTSSTTIEFSLEKEAQVVLSVFNSIGQEINTLMNRNIPMGNYSVIWNGNDKMGSKVNNGLYFCRLLINDGQEISVDVRQMIKLKK